LFRYKLASVIKLAHESPIVHADYFYTYYTPTSEVSAVKICLTHNTHMVWFGTKFMKYQ